MINKEDLEVFNTLSNLKERINFVNNIIFSKDNYDELEYLLSLEEDEYLDDIDYMDETGFEVFDDIDNFSPEDDKDILSIYLYNIINNKSMSFIDLQDSKDFNVVILGEMIYIGYSKDEDLEYFKTIKILNNNLIAVTENKPIPSLIKPYIGSNKTKIYKIIGILDDHLSMS